MKVVCALASWLTINAFLCMVTSVDARRLNSKRKTTTTNCSPYTGRKNCKIVKVSCGEHFLEPDSEVALSSDAPHRRLGGNTCKWKFKTAEDHDLRITCRTTVNGPPKCRTSNLLISDGNKRRIKFCSSIPSAGLTSETGEMNIISHHRSRRAAGRFKYECTVASVEVMPRTSFTIQPPIDTTLPVSRCKCGRTNRARRIVGGNQVEPHEYPWQVAFFRRNSTSPFCGGSIISDRWILTAAHCLLRVNPKTLQVAIGEHDWSKTNETTITRRMKVKYIVRHQGFSVRKPLQHDIGLVELAEPLDFPEDNSVAPVCLPRPDLIYPKAEALVVGWGATEDKFAGPSKVLRVADVQTITNDVCQTLVALKGGVTPNMICAGYIFNDETACYGDSGGPLLTKGEACGGRCLTNIGVVSWGAFCNIGALPTVYTRTNRYLDWINMFIKGSNICER